MSLNHRKMAVYDSATASDADDLPCCLQKIRQNRRSVCLLPPMTRLMRYWQLPVRRSKCATGNLRSGFERAYLFRRSRPGQKSPPTLFVTGYGVMHRWRKMPDDSQMLLVGADNFPFPIPLKKNNDGQWFFDTAAGKNEVLNPPHRQE